MSHLLPFYISLSPSSPRSQVSSVLQSVISAPPYVFNSNARAELIEVLLADLKCCKKGGNKGRLTPEDAAQALTAVKTLGKNPAASEVLSTPPNLSTLLALSTSFKDDPDACNEALRCVANALLLVEAARTNWVRKDVGGSEACVELLEKSTAPEQIFLASRILFLCTASAASSASYIRALVENKHLGSAGNIVNIIGLKLDLLTNSILGGVKMSREAMTDLLKLTFNFLVHYPKLVDCEPQDSKRDSGDDESKVMGDYWSPRLDGILPPLLRVFNSLPPSFPGPLASPLTHVIHSLITIPVSPSLHSAWFGSGSSASSPPSSRSGRSSSNNSPTASKPSLPLPATGSRSTSPNRASSKEAKPGAVDRALSVLAAGRRSLSRSSSPQSASNTDTLLRAHDLLEVSLSHYLPGRIDPDDPAVRETCKKEGDNSLDELAAPLVVLITRLCIADGTARSRTREWLLPADLDRTRPLEARADMLGRCLRLLGCVYHPRLKDAVGEMLFAVCDSNATALAGQVGYGNVAGFLFHKGIMKPPPPTSSAPSSEVPLVTPEGVEINPITGIAQEKLEVPEMSEEEKEREAEKLFVLFERLEKTGVIPPDQNPIRKAVQQGKMGPR